MLLVFQCFFVVANLLHSYNLYGDHLSHPLYLKSSFSCLQPLTDIIIFGFCQVLQRQPLVRGHCKVIWSQWLQCLLKFLCRSKFSDKLTMVQQLACAATSISFLPICMVQSLFALVDLQRCYHSTMFCGQSPLSLCSVNNAWTAACV